MPLKSSAISSDEKCHIEFGVEPSLYTPLDSLPLENSISKSILNIENKNRSNLLPWKGQFSPQLIEKLLEKYCKENFFVLDPFLGSGTVLVEAGRKHLKCFGTEINPAAYFLSSIYTLMNEPKNEREDIISRIEKQLNKQLFQKYGLYSSDFLSPKPEELQQKLILLLEDNTDINIKKIISAHIILLDFYKNDTTVEKIQKTWKRLKQILISLPYSDIKIGLSNSDARAIPLANNVVDLVITSPPYINVFNYHQQYRASTEALGINLLTVAKSEIGSNRKYRENRFLTVVQYTLDMYDCLVELRRVCKLYSKIIFIIGRESNVRKTRFYNSEIIASLAKLSGMELCYRQERVFLNRYGQQIYEDILHFKNTSKRIIQDDKKIRESAKQILIDALDRAPKEAIEDLTSAIAQVEKVKKSPIYKVRNYQKILGRVLL